MSRPHASPTPFSWQALLACVFLVAGALSCEGGCGGADVCDPSCQSWEACVNGSCQARTCYSSDECGGGACTFARSWDDPDSARDPGTCGPRTCGNDSQCDDGLFCNGREYCAEVPGRPIFGCLAEPAPCGESQVCDEAADRCYDQCSVEEDADRDGDGFPSAACCNVAGDGERTCGSDCDDQRAGIHPIAPEVCDGLDQDCDGAIDEGVLIHAYTDADEDGYGAAGSTATPVCDTQLGSGFSVYANDCNDANAALTPGTFVCEGGQDPQAVTLCTNTGTFTKVSCGGNLVCVTQPNGLGVCR